MHKLLHCISVLTLILLICPLLFVSPYYLRYPACQSTFDFLLVALGLMDLYSWNAVKIENNGTLIFQGSNGSPPSPPPAINWGSQNFISPFMPLTSLQKHLRWNWMRNSTIYFRVVGSSDEFIPNSCYVTGSKNTIITTGKDLFH